MLAARYVEREASPASDAWFRSARISGQAKSVKKQTLGSDEGAEANRVRNCFYARHEIAFGNYEVATVGIGDCCRPGQWQVPTRFTLSKPVIPIHLAKGKLRFPLAGSPFQMVRFRAAFWMEAAWVRMPNLSKIFRLRSRQTASIPRSDWISPRKKFRLVTSTMVCVLTLPH